MLIDFVKGLLPSFSRADILEDTRITAGEFDNGSLELWRNASSFYDKEALFAKENTERQKAFYREYTSPVSKSSKNMVVEIARVLPNVRANLDHVVEELTTLLDKHVFSEAMDTKKANFVKAAECMSFISRFSLDLLMYIYAMEAKAAGAKNVMGSEISKSQMRIVEDFMPHFAILLGGYGLPSDEFKAKMRAIPNMYLDDKTYEAAAAAYKEATIDPIAPQLSAGFYGSPIYRVRMLFAEWQAYRYKSFEAKKASLELRLTHLKLQKAQGTNPGIEKQIEQLQERIDALDYKMKKMEEDVGL